MRRSHAHRSLGGWVTNKVRCYCGNELNTKGLEYAGFSVYEDGVDLAQRNPSRTWACRQVSTHN